MSRRGVRAGALLAAFGCTALACQPAGAATRYDPRLRFKVITTQNFFIYFHQGEADLAQRLARIAEEVHQTLIAGALARPHGRTHVILVDQTDYANGWATPLPFNTIELTAAWPTQSELVGNTDDWLRLVFSHEYAHIFHLDRARGLAAGLRRVLGRAPFAFPNLFLPQWQIEGLATYQETRLNPREGRLHVPDFRLIVDEAARQGRFDPIDRVNGGLVDWPSGLAAYAYGAAFYEYLVSRFGPDAVERIARRTSQGLFFTSGVAFKREFGHRLQDLWRDFERARTAAVQAERAAPPPTRLTRHGFVVAGPRFSPDGEILYSTRNPREFPALMRVRPGGAPHRIASRYFGDRLGVSAHAIYFDQLERARNASVVSDLYVVDRPGGRVRRLTREARLLEPDLSPDGRVLACIRLEPDRRAVALVRLRNAETTGAAREAAAAETLVSEASTQFGSPRWSPDGVTLVAERRRLGGPSEIVLIDTRTRDVRTLVSSASSRNITPAWMPDGRTVIFASDRDGRAFNLYAIDVDAWGQGPPAKTDKKDESDATTSTAPDAAESRLSQIARTPTGATSPDISPDGTTIVYVGYTVDGYDLFTIPFDRLGWHAAAADATPIAPPSTRHEPAQPAGVTSYSPFPALLPRFWVPLVEADSDDLKVGFFTGGVDALGRHGYFVTAAWHATDPAVQAGARLRGRTDWQIGYAYDRWYPTLFAGASVDHSAVVPAAGAERGASPARLMSRERQATAGVLLPVRRVRSSHTWFGALNYEDDMFTGANGSRSLARHAIRLAWSYTSAKGYGYSISNEEGVTVTLASEHVRHALGASGNADSATAELRGYRRIGPRHGVIAVRIAGGASTGDAAVRRVFALGGHRPGGSFGFGRDALSLMRGFPEDSFAGQRTAVANVDYRWPILYVERGYRTWPIFLRSLHAGAFVDAGDAWNGRFSLANLKTAAGGELSLDLLTGYRVPLTATVGAAWGWDPSGVRADGARFYVRLGRAF